MKRHGGGPEGGDYNRAFPKRQRGDGYAEALAIGKFELRLLVSSKSAGAIIGKGGDNIKRLRSQFDATVSVPDSTSPERILTAVTSLDNISPLCREVLPKLEDTAGDGRREVRFLVHQSHAGAIIGRGGAKIKDLREETHANIKVFSQCAPQSTDRIVQIIGPENVMPEAIQTIVFMVKEIPVKGQTRQYDTINYDPSIVNDYGGYPLERNMGGPSGNRFGPPGGGGPPHGRGGMGPGGMMHARNGGPPGGGRAMGPPMPSGPMLNGRPPMNGGAPFGSPSAPPPHLSGVGVFGQGGGPPMGGHGGPPMGGQMAAPPFQPFHAGGHGAPPPGAPMKTTQVTIPSELGGTIIGRGGERINRIREDSGAHIVLEPLAPGQEERIITISGSEQQIHTAQYFLQQCVRSSLAQGGGGPGPRKFPPHLGH